MRSAPWWAVAAAAVSLATGGCGDDSAGDGGTPSSGGALPAGGTGGQSPVGGTGGQPMVGGSGGQPTVGGTGGTPLPVTGGSAGVPATAGGSGGAPPGCASDCGSHKWACWPMPNPVGSGLPNPAQYTDGGDGTVLDELTCLTWQQTPPSGDFTWDEGLQYCDDLTLGGYDDWRLPTRIELTSIMDFTAARTKVDASAFPDAPGGFHRTSSDWILTITQTGAGAGNDFAWAFNMSDGIVSNAYSKTGRSAVPRCVRGNGAGEAPSDPAVAPPNLYMVGAPGEVVDNYTGLVWQQGYSETRLSHDAAIEYCASLDLNGQAWRLPSIRELATLVDEAQVAPAIDRTAFPDTQYGSRSNDWYWASHQAVGTTAGWAINFDDGFTGFNVGDPGDWNYFTEAWAKCVR